MRKLRFATVKYWDFQAWDCKFKRLRFYYWALDNHRAIYSHLVKNITVETWISIKNAIFFLSLKCLNHLMNSIIQFKSFWRSFSIKQKTARLHSKRYAVTRHCINLLFTIGEFSSITCYGKRRTMISSQSLTIKRQAGGTLVNKNNYENTNLNILYSF